nr:sporulation protein rmd5 [Hymenolepis microstoma]
MTAKDENIILEKLQNQTIETEKIEKGLHDFHKKYDQKSEAHAEALLKIVQELKSVNSDAALSPDVKIRICSLLSNIKSDFTEATSLHRGIHGNISKFKKTIEKTFVEDTSAFTKYITGDPTRCLPLLMNELFPESEIYKNVDAMSDDELFSTIVIEELVRSGYGPVAIQLAKEVGLSEEDVGMEKFREVGSMVCALKDGDLEPARAWLEAYEPIIGSMAKDLKYVLAKLEFLTDVQKCSGNPAAVIGCLSKISPFSKDYPEDFKHIMGSLLFLNRDLTNTPYADLSFTDQPNNLSHFIISSGVSLPTLPMMSLFTSTEGEKKPEGERGDAEPMDAQNDMDTSCPAADSDENFKPNAFVRAAHLFGAVACQYQLKLSTIDPLRMAFASGLKVLPKLYETQKAFTWLQSYTRAGPHGIQTLPVTIELDSVAQQHNIFHCPVEKEVSNWLNPVLRLHCGHAITRDAYNNMLNNERNSRRGKLKCPYCPKETTRDQLMVLHF